MPPPVVRGLYLTQTVDPTPLNGFKFYINNQIPCLLFLAQKEQDQFLRRIQASLMCLLLTPLSFYYCLDPLWVMCLLANYLNNLKVIFYRQTFENTLIGFSFIQSNGTNCMINEDVRELIRYKIIFFSLLSYKYETAIHLELLNSIQEFLAQFQNCSHKV